LENIHGVIDNGNGARFPLVVLDEASQCTEPALMCALVAARAEQLVMVGDTKQLPPTVASSSEALRKSLGISPMERLEKFGLVEETILQIQYRMVQALLDHPSKYFYNGLVKSAVGSTATQDIFSTTKKDSSTAIPAGFPWPNPLVPLAFVGVGKGEAEVLHDSALGLAGRSNPTEAELVAQIVANIIQEGELKSSQLCVLSPYSKQVSLIRSMLEKQSLIRRFRNKNTSENNSDNLSNPQCSSTAAMTLVRSISDVRVGTVDSFQGQESDLVIFSAVRSNRFSELGFLRDPRRLCVALTRARQALIVLGDSTVLQSCRHWRSLIDSCHARNCFMDVDRLVFPQLHRSTRDGNNVYKNDQAEGAKDSTSTEEIMLCEDVKCNNEKMTERKKLSLLKPDEEFLGLF